MCLLVNGYCCVHVRVRDMFCAPFFPIRFCCAAQIPAGQRAEELAGDAKRLAKVLRGFVRKLGFYLVSNGTGQPWRVRIRPPCFAITQGLSDLINGAMLSDIVPTFGSLNMIGGECDH